jgi:hypothetical protein
MRRTPAAPGGTVPTTEVAVLGIPAVAGIQLTSVSAIEHPATTFG